MKMKKSLVMCISFFVMLGISAYFLQPQKVEIEEIDYQQYHKMLEYISSEERSLGSEYHDLMRDYLVEELEERGLEVQLINSDENEIVYTEKEEVFNGGVSNIYATLPATQQSENTKNLVFASHYDSVAGSYGAADAGLPVISFFAGLDAILDQERVNDISILITDHEELGLVGAKYIMDNRPEIVQDIDFIYNWESRGTGGNIILFETSEKDYEAVKYYSDVVDQQFTASIATAVYSQMPNGSDFTKFVDAGLPGLNFAMIEDFANYHTSLDHIDNIPMETFNYYVNNVVQLMEHSATEEFKVVSSQRSIYFNLFDFSIVFPEWFVLWMVIFTTVGALAILGTYSVSKTIKIKQLGMSLVSILGGFLIANVLPLIPVSLFGAFSEFKPYQPEAAKIRFTLLYNHVYTILLSIILIVGVIALVKWFKQKKWINQESLFVSALLLAVILQVIIYQVLYGAIVLTLIPLIVLEISYLLNKKLKVEYFNGLIFLVLVPLLYPILYYVYIALTVNSIGIYMNLLMISIVYFMYLFVEKSSIE